MKASNNQVHANAEELQPGDARPKIVVVSGPTAVGKTALAIELARQFNGEVVNADSRYLYRGFDIGVAKPDLAERKGVPHHLIDILPPDGEMSLATYQDLAMTAIHGVLGRQRLPLLVGGTPLYINAVVEGWRIPRVPPNPEFRAALEAEVRGHGVAALSERLHTVDSASAMRCGHNARRIIRALEVFAATGIPMSVQEGKGPPPFEALELGLSLSRDALYRAIDDRVADQIERGLVQEIRTLLEGGVNEDASAMSSLGYRQLLPYLRGEVTPEEAAERIRFDTHRYVRHQETWLRRNPRLIWYDTAQPGWVADVMERVDHFLAKSQLSENVD